jgi:hypothetical protein
MGAATKLALAALCIATTLSSSACSRSNNLLFGRVETTVAAHTVVVTDCYRASVPPPQQIDPATWRFAPCQDADVLIRDEQLTVNGRSYGRLQPADAVLVDHGVVSIGPPQR